MAVITYSALIDKIRGSIGNVTFSRARWGEFVRYRTRPRDPRSDDQAQYRVWFTAAVTQWRDVLNDAERLAWNTLGDDTTLFNSAGDPYHPSGFNLAVGINAFLKQCVQGMITTAPAAARWDAPSFSEPAIAAAAGTLTDNTGWSDPETGWVHIRESPPLPDTTYDYYGPWIRDQVATIAAFHAGAPVALTTGPPWVEGKRYFLAVKAIKTLGSLSHEAIVNTIVTP